MFKRHLTLLLKVDNLLSRSAMSGTTPDRCALSAGSRQLRQEHREQSDRRQERANMIDEAEAGMVGHAAEDRRAETADPKRESEEHPGDHPEPVRHQFLRKHDD